MTDSEFNIFIRVVRRRLAKGEWLEDILLSYPKLSESEKAAIRKAVTD